MTFTEDNDVVLLFVFIVTLAVIFVGAIVGLALVIRKASKRHREFQQSELHEFFAKKLYDVLHAAGRKRGEQRILVKDLKEHLEHAGPFSRRLQRETLRGVMIDAARDLVGDSRVVLNQMFAQLGFVDEELRDLRSKHWWVRAKACRATSLMESRAALDPLVALLEDNEEDVRVEAAMALVTIAGTDALGPLLHHLRMISVWMSLHLSQAILKLGSSAVDDLMKGLNVDPPSVRSFCVQMLGALGDVRAIAPLIEFARDAEVPLRCQTITALSVLGDESSMSFLMECCSHESEDVRRSAAAALGRIDAPMAVPFLRDLLVRDSVDVKLAAGESLARLGRPGMEALREVIGSADELARSIARQFRNEFEPSAQQ